MPVIEKISSYAFEVVISAILITLGALLFGPAFYQSAVDVLASLVFLVFLLLASTITYVLWRSKVYVKIQKMKNPVNSASNPIET